MLIETRRSKDGQRKRTHIHDLIGESAWTNNVRHQIARLAQFDCTVLVSGPTGTGKELIARAIHNHSARSNGPFVTVDCAAIVGELMASQLFGHKRGAFTGASQDAIGSFRAAEGGTLFLDELGELDIDLQSNLLRVLQERVIYPVGDHRPCPVDVRIVSATNRDLLLETSAGRFREDLYYRVNVACVESLPLRERVEDINPLIDHYLEQCAGESGLPTRHISQEAVATLRNFAWPGNVRQLKHLIEQALISCDSNQITDSLVRQLLSSSGQSRHRGIRSLPMPAGDLPSLSSPPEDQGSDLHISVNDRWPTLSELEREFIAKTLESTHFNKAAAARRLGITRQTLLRKIERLSIACQ